MPRERSNPAHDGYASIVGSGLLLVLAAASIMLGRSKLKNDEAALYAEISRLERQLEEVRRSNGRFQVDYETLTALVPLAARIKDMHLSLVMPGDDARIVLPEPGFAAASRVRVAGTPPPPAPAADPTPLSVPAHLPAPTLSHPATLHAFAPAVPRAR